MNRPAEALRVPRASAAGGTTYLFRSETDRGGIVTVEFRLDDAGAIEVVDVLANAASE